jgi:hypothetical protein
MAFINLREAFSFSRAATLFCASLHSKITATRRTQRIAIIHSKEVLDIGMSPCCYILSYYCPLSMSYASVKEKAYHTPRYLKNWLQTYNNSKGANMSNYVCVKSGETVKRVLRAEADKLVSSGGWNFCPRKEWKEKVRDANRAVIAENVREAVAAQDTSRNAARKAKNLKGKARKVAEKAVEPKADAPAT